MVMFPAHDIIDLLQARASSGHAAFRIAESLLTKIMAALRRDSRFAGISQFEMELLLADVSNDAGNLLFAEMRDRVLLADAEHAVHQCLGEED
jgi:hypothetical protein